MIITILRKPLEGTVAENTLKHGCGALNIDATRINTSDNLNGGAYAENPTERGGEDMWTSSREADSNCFRRGGAGDYEQPSGRWPANFILIHKKGCELKANIGKFYEGGWSHQEIDEGNKLSDDENNEKVADWDCEEGCPVKSLDNHSGVSKSTGGRIGNKGGAYSHLGETGFKNNAVKGDPGFGDSGGASRFFKQFKKENDQ